MQLVTDQVKALSEAKQVHFVCRGCGAAFRDLTTFLEHVKSLDRCGDCGWVSWGRKGLTIQDDKRWCRHAVERVLPDRSACHQFWRK